MKLKKFLYRNFIAVICAVCALSFSVGYFGSVYTQRLYANRQAKISAVSDNEEKIQPSTQIVLIRQYLKSDSVNIKEISPGSDMIGEGMDYVKSAYEGWEIGSYSKEKISLYKQIDSYAPGVYLITSMIREDDGTEVVAVYEYDIEGEKILKESFDSPIELLPQSEITKLREGITVRGENELEALLENYSE